MCKCDWEKCRKDCECRCHIGIEAHSKHSYLVGQFAGLEKAADALMKRAADAFSNGRDEEAKLLRFWSEYMKVEAKGIHPGPRPKFETIERA